MSTTPSQIPNLVQIRPRGLAGKWLEYNQFFNMPFLRNTPTGETGRRIFMLDSSNDADSGKDVPFVDLDQIWLISLWGQILKAPILRARIGVLKPNSPNTENFILLKLLHCTDRNEILHNDRDHQVLFVGCPNLPQTNPIWWTAAILKNRKILISSQPIDRFWRNLACWCASILPTMLH